jgi:hypothetical protein
MEIFDCKIILSWDHGRLFAWGSGLEFSILFGKKLGKFESRSSNNSRNDCLKQRINSELQKEPFKRLFTLN